MNVAVTVVGAFTVTVQEPVPEQPPPVQPMNDVPTAGAADSVTCVPSSNDALHEVPQSIAADGAVLVTVPAPVPAFVMLSWWVGGGGAAVKNRTSDSPT